MSNREAAQRSREIVRPEKPFAAFRWVVTLGLLVVFFGTVSTVDITFSNLLALPERTWFYLELMLLPPDLDVLGQALTEMFVSLSMAWIGTLIAALFSFPLGFMAAQNLASGPTVFAARQVLNFFRAVPEIIFLILFIPIFGLSPMAVALALGISSIGTIGKLTAEVVEAIDHGPIEAVDASGGSKLQRIRWAVIPQVMPEVVAIWLYRFEINIRNSAVAGAVGAGGIGTFLVVRISQTRDWQAAGTGLLVMILVTLAVDTISGRLRRRIIRGPTRPVDIGANAGDPSHGTGPASTNRKGDGPAGSLGEGSFAPI
jgi:phosphonate transport system permease protein